MTGMPVMELAGDPADEWVCNAPEAGRHGFIDLPPELEALFL